MVIKSFIAFEQNTCSCHDPLYFYDGDCFDIPLSTYNGIAKTHSFCLSRHDLECLSCGAKFLFGEIAIIRKTGLRGSDFEQTFFFNNKESGCKENYFVVTELDYWFRRPIYLSETRTPEGLLRKCFIGPFQTTDLETFHDSMMSHLLLMVYLPDEPFWKV